ncbi:MAG: hypothetical protein QF830_06785, partial [Rhodospirillales bacterium]|nr:hypothetical protein [Rhodospirillales bacterium]
MIRSLFLIAILVTLVAIAFKRPEQSALEFAQEVTEKTQATMAAKMPESLKPEALAPIPTIAPAPPPARKSMLEITGKIEDAIKGAEERRPASKKSIVEPSPMAAMPPAMKLDPPPAPAKRPATPSMERLLLPKATASKPIDVPSMPSAPIARVAMEPLDRSETLGAKISTKPLRFSDSTLNEVRANL